MKQWITFGISALVLLASCDKRDTLDTTSEPLVASAAAGNASVSARATASSDGIYASDWMQSASWNSYDSLNFRIFYTEEGAPQISNDILANGVVVTFGRVSLSAPEYQQFNNPTMLPFYFVGTNGRPQKNSFYFYDHPSEGTARISYSTQATDGSMPAGTSLGQFQFRYFVITSSFLSQHNLTEEMIRSNYTYNQLMELAGIKE